MQNDIYDHVPAAEPLATHDWFVEVTGEKSLRAIAQRAGLDQSKVHRQLRGTSDLKVETVVAICRAYNIDLLRAFVAAGFISQLEARAYVQPRPDLQSASDIELSQEILRRISAGKATATLTEPIDVSGGQEDLTQMDEDQLRSRYDLAANTDHTAPDPEDHTP